MGSRIFESFNGGRAQREAEQRTNDERAIELATETCERYRELRAEALQAEANAESPVEWHAEAAECMRTLDALMRGRHRPVVQRVLLEYFPELLTPATATEQELAAAMAATASKPAN